MSNPTPPRDRPEPVFEGTAAQPEPSQPFRPEIVGTLRKRVLDYARAKGRSMSGAVMWVLSEGLKREGF